jgi:serine/threonine-protein kinase
VIGAATIAMARPTERMASASETMVAPPLPPRDGGGERRRNPNRRRLWILLIAVGVIALAIAAGAFAFIGGDGGGGSTTTPTTPSALVEIPDLAGQTQEEATAALKALGFDVLVTEQASTTAPAGQVIGTRPAAGGKVPKGTTVELQVSSGPKAVTVPDVVNATQADATSTLQGLGLVVATEQGSSDAVPEGSVISQNPSAGSSVKPGSTVTLTISTGQQQTTVPNLTGMSVGDAQNALIAAGLALGGQSEQNDAAPAGQVIGQSPSAGSSASAGAAVDIVVSKGPAASAVPSVVNQSSSSAQAAISAAGFSPNVVEQSTSDPALDGIVISQNPGGGTQKPQGSTVTIVVGRYGGG